ncbi:MAG: ABC transporter ATP-binding protein, partial [Candidatus Zixiibacteriota bacterium]
MSNLDTTQIDKSSQIVEHETSAAGHEAPAYVGRKMRFSWWMKIKWMTGFYLRFKYVLFVLLSLTAVHAVTIVMQPVVFRNVFDSLRGGPDALNGYNDVLTRYLVSQGLTTPGQLTFVFVLFAAASFLIYLFLQNHRAWMNTRLEMAFRQRVFDDITEFGPRFHGSHSVGDIVTRLTDDVAEKLSWFACSGIFRFYEALLLVTFGITVMISLNPTLTLYTITPLPLLIVLFRASAAKLDRRYDYLQSRISRLNDLMEACFSGIRVIKAYRQERAQRRQFESVVDDRRQAEISAIKAQQIIESFYMYVWEFGLVLAMIVGGYMVIHDQITLGEYLAFDFFVLLMIMPMLDIGQFLVKGLQSAVSIDRLMELQSQRQTRMSVGGARDARESSGKISFEDVKLSLDGQRKTLDGVSFKITPGSTVAFVGKVGSGKTWAANLIPRLIDPDSGVVSLDGHALPDYRIETLREVVGYASQEPTLFSDTIENNIRFGRENVSDDDIRRATKLAQLDEELARFPAGISTSVGTRGLTISGGQKQRVAMARALAGNPRLLILDDCTSALDARTEDQLWEALKNHSGGITSIIITHRTATLRNV